MSQSTSARTYNQSHTPRKYQKGRRRVSIYLAWSYPGEANRNATELDNRFSTMTEVRRVLWPDYESAQWADPLRFQQGIAGSLELFFWAWVNFQQLVAEVTGHVVPVFQRVDQAGFSLPLDERVLADADTLLLFGLDHVVTEQRATREEIEAVRGFLSREGTCLEARREDAYLREGHTARTLARAPDLRVVLVVMKAGARIAEHRANETAMVHALSGHVRLRLPDDETVELSSGSLLVLDGGVRHDVEALAESSFLLTLGWKAR